MNLTSFDYDTNGVLIFFVANSFNDGLVKGKYLMPNPVTQSYEFKNEVEEDINSFENGFVYVYEGGTTSRSVPFDEIKNLVRPNPLTPKLLQ